MAVLGWRLAHLRPLLAVTAALVAGAAVTGWALGGGLAAGAAAAGVGLTAASYLASTLVIAWADTVNPQLVLPFGLVAYLTKFTLLGLVLVGLTVREWPGMVPMGIGVAVGVVGWTSTQIWWVVRHPPRLEYPDRPVPEE